jgi:phosphoribosylamine--glycine ligase
MKEGQVVTAGGRVLCVTALGDSVAEAQQSAYQTVEKISWQDAYYRTDIAYRAVAREQVK